MQVLITILSAFSTRSLLPLIVVSRRFHSVILRILHFRLLLAASAPEYKIILEAYHPSRRYTQPYLFCNYLGTDGLSSKHEGEGSLYEGCVGPEGKFAKLGALYSRFRPESPGVQGSVPLRRIAGAPVQSTSGNTTQPIYANGGDGGIKKVLYSMTLDADELFGQFCAYANLVQLGPMRGVFLSTVPLVESGEGVIRIWREWLQDRVKVAKNEDEEIGVQLDRSSTLTCPTIGQDEGVLWTDYRRNVGLRLGVKQSPTMPDDALGREDLPLSVSVELQGKVIRAEHIVADRRRTRYSYHPPDVGRGDLYPR